VLKKGFSLAPRWLPSHPALRRIGTLMLPTIFGSAIYQINQLVGTLLATLLKEGSVSYLYYADRLVQFPLGVFAIAISTAVLPSLSREAADGDFAGLRGTISHAIRLTMFITIPAMMGLIVLGEPIVRLLFQRGAFDVPATDMTARALLYYSVGLWAFAGLRVFVSAFYSLQDTTTPVKVAVIAMVLNLIFSLILMRTPLEHGGLALALSLASTVQLVILILLLRGRIGGIEGKTVLGSMAKSFLSSMIMAIGIYWLSFKFLAVTVTGTMASLAFCVLLVMGAGILIYLLSARLLGCTELTSVMKVVRRSRRRA